MIPNDGEEDSPESLYPVDGYFTDVAVAVKRPPAWLIEGLLPQGLVFLAGPPKEAYKSTLTMAMSALIARFLCRGVPQEWKPVTRGPVMVFSHEADAGELRYTLEDGLGVKLTPTESIIVCNEPEHFRLDDEGEDQGISQMLYWLNLRKPALVIIDPLANFHSVEEKDSGRMIQLVAPLRRWAKNNGATVLVVHHTRKLDEDRPYRAADMRGTSALFGLADGILVVTPTKQRCTLTIEGIFKRGKGWTKTITFGFWELKGKGGGEALREVDELILKAVRHGYASLKEVARHTNLGTKSAQERLNFLLRNGHLKKTDKGFKETGS